MKVVFDSCILIDYLNGIKPAKAEIEALDKGSRCISTLTWIEVMVGVEEDHIDIVSDFLASFTVLSLNADVAMASVTVRKERKIKLPDAIIEATAIANNALLVTRNTKDFQASVSVRIPYTL
ncbi:type II toxin-antitoxin system VapC family toxin [Kordiimonas pumila]|uniref:type II toxin-antitoxin system VapC family toxin n=1 Tax=Kordiimonas pumila TaxID=2161677 RepID=UPI001D16B1D3|nr:type II toxin-antitoxin system VapC family toxin [Kordiimonas pumila]